MRTHGQMVDPGDEFNRNPMFFCGKCSTIHGTLLPQCDGLRGGYLSFKPSPAIFMSTEQADRRPDGMPTSKYERDLRRIVGAQSGIKGLYTDDGEMQGEEDGINIDFMRDEVDSINRKLLELGISRMKKQQVMNPWQQAIDDEMVTLHLGGAWGDPKACLKELLDWHVSVALDPSVSSDAAALVDRGRAEAKKLEQTCKDFEDALLDAMQTLAWLQFGECRGYSYGLLTAREAIEKGMQVLVKHRGNCETI